MNRSLYSIEILLEWMRGGGLGTGLLYQISRGLPFNHDSHSQQNRTELTRATKQNTLTNIWSGLLHSLAVLNLQIMKLNSTNKI